jgi:hypothetical protein
VAEWTETQTPPALLELKYRMMYFDGYANEERSWDGTRLRLPLGVRMNYMIEIYFLASNNVTEYEALVNG